ncbi:MAG: hypothetical protein OHK0031_18080 [Anaerolineales bacterium]
MPDTLTRIEFLRKLHLFRGLSDDQLRSVAEKMQEMTFSATDVAIVEGTSGDLLYFIFDGKARVSRLVKDVPTPVTELSKGDYFGEQSLLTSRAHNATVRAETGSVLLTLSREAFRTLLKKIPGLRENFIIMMDTRRLANQLKFPWLNEGEVIYFLARKHEVLLYRALALPVVALALTATLQGVAFMLSSVALSAAAAFLLVLALAWLAWNHIDWGNDYYIVTNQRVLWLEKVVGLYESRTEAMMSTVLSVSTESDYWGRFFGYGTVVVRTFTGQIRMEYVRYPKQAGAMIEEYWNRTKQGARKSDEEAFKAAIRAKLGIQLPAAKPVAPAAAPAPSPAAKPSSPARPALFSGLEKRLGDAFNARYETGAVITYRKHPYVLFRDTLPQILAILALLLIVPVGKMFFPWNVQFWQLAILGFLLAAAIAWWAYGYVDWANDLYQVTPEQIVDLYREPFGKEDRKSAPLESILSINYERNGVLGMFLNFGTVYIQVGGAKFDFEDVMNPPGVQQDIASRVFARQQKKRESDAAGERERMIEWMAWYHKTVEEARKLEEQARKQNDKPG